MVYLSSEIIYDNSIDDDEVGIYISLREILTGQNNNSYFISTDQIGFVLYDRMPTKREKTTIKNSLDKLNKSGLIAIEEVFSSSMFRINLQELYFDMKTDGHYMCIDYKEIHTIMNIDSKTDKFKLLRYFCCLVGTFNHSKKIDIKYRGKISNLTINQLASIMNLNERAVMRYNELLEENEVIYIYRSDGFEIRKTKSDINIKRDNNLYARYCDRDILSQYYIENINKSLCTYNSIDGYTKSEKQSLIMKYSYLCKDKEYSDEVVTEIYEFICVYNQEQKRLAEEQIEKGYTGENYLSKVKSMEVFSKFEFLKELIA